jgi:hypothetical protein
MTEVLHSDETVVTGSRCPDRLAFAKPLFDAHHSGRGFLPISHQTTFVTEPSSLAGRR